MTAARDDAWALANGWTLLALAALKDPTRCQLHNHNVHVPARYLALTRPAGNQIRLCEDCALAFRRDCPDNLEWIRTL